MKSQKGMGHLATILSIIIIISVIVGIVFYVKNQMQEGRKQNYETDMLLIQGKVKILSQEATIQKNEELLKGRKIEENLEDEEIKLLLEKEIIKQDEENFAKYYILEKSNLEEMGLDNLELKEGYYLVNYSTYEIIYTKGVIVSENTYYKLSELEALTLEEEQNKQEQEQTEEQPEEQKAEWEQKQEEQAN